MVIHSAPVMARVLAAGLPAAIISALALLAGNAAQALGWDYIPSASVGAGYESNPNSASRSGQRDDSYVATASGRVDIIGETQRTRISLRPEIRSAVYSGMERDSRDDSYVNYYLPMSISESWQTLQASLGAGVSRISTRDSVVVGFDPNTPPQPGIDTANRRTEYQERWYIAPSLRYQLTPRDLISLSLNHDDITYTEAEFSLRTDYTATAGQLAWSHSWTQRSTLSLSGNVSTFEASRPNSPIKNDTLTYGLTAGYQYALSPISMVGASAGGSRSEVKIKGLPWIFTSSGLLLPCLDPESGTFVACSIKSTAGNFIGEVFYRQRPDRTVTTELRLSRAIQPSSDGSQVTVDQIAGYYTKELTPLLSLKLSAMFWKQDAVSREANALSNRFRRDYYSVEAAATQRLGRHWSISGRYRYTDDERDFDILSRSISNHRFYLTLNYQGLGSH